ncbi:MAG: hypothetical protein IPK52_07785 [Chloroflexi bacterium]|nr:hypothetical protein [Chloroflexota bacterium]
MTTHILIADSSSLAVVGGQTLKPRNRANLFAVAGGLMQIVVAVAILFLPVFATCISRSQEMVCQRQSYIQQGGSVLGFALLVLMIVAGVLALVSTRIESVSQAGRFRWIAVLLSVSFAIVGAWSIGLIFVPGAVFLLAAALACRQRPSQQR